MHVPPHMTCMYPPPHMTWQVLNKLGEVNLAVINACIPSSYDMVCMYPPPRMKWQVLNKFGEVNLAEINSKGGFFMGIIKRFREQERGVFAGTNCLLIVSLLSRLIAAIFTSLKSATIASASASGKSLDVSEIAKLTLFVRSTTVLGF